MIPPTVGRVVWFYKYAEGQGHKGPLVGHVCKVHSDRLVNLFVINEEGQSFSCIAVRLVQPNEEVPAADYCTWMPYQVGQAAKAEAAERELAAVKAAPAK